MMMKNPAGLQMQVKQPVYAKILHSTGGGGARKACRVACGGGITADQIPPIKGTTPPPPLPMAKLPMNPCLDLFSQEFPKANVLSTNVLGSLSRQHLNQLLPAAWSHNPLTTLKLICSLLDGDDPSNGLYDEEAFYTASYWLHQNHPRTLASNLPSVASSFGNLLDVLEILFRIRLLESSKRRPNSDGYGFLHDQISDIFAQCLKSDIQILNNHKNNKPEQENDDKDYCLELSDVARFFPVPGDRRCTGRLQESIARKVFPRESYPEYQGLDEAQYTLQARNRLDVEVLQPLERVVGRRGVDQDPGYNVTTRKSHYNPGTNGKEYLDGVSKSTISLAADAMLPHEIVEYVTSDSELGEAAELQWKTMVEHYKYSDNNLSNCLALCDPRGHEEDQKLKNACLGLAILVSQLAEEPWKGKVVTFVDRDPQIVNIDDQGHEDLRSKCSFLKEMYRDRDSKRMSNFPKVFDLILQEAVKENLKPDQMIKRVFVFTATGYGVSKWETRYEAIRKRFKDKGYGEEVVPHLVFWSLAGNRYTPPVHCSTAHNGVTILSGFNDYLVKSFLDNHGDIGPDHVIEAAVSAQKYQDLVVVD